MKPLTDSGRLGPAGMSHGLRTLTLVALAGLAAAAPRAVHAADAASPPASAGSSAAVSLTVSAIQPTPTVLGERLPANGSVAAWQEAVVASEASGLRLADIRAQVGDRVRKGQLLASFAAELVQAELAQARAGLAEAEAALAEAAGNARRARELQPTGALSEQQVQQLLTAERVAQARLEVQQAMVKTQGLRLQQAEVRAPDDGVITTRAATLGAVSQPGQELFRLIRQSRLEWRAEVPSADLGRIRPGMSATVQLPGGPALTGKVRLIAPTVDAANRNGLVHVDLPADGAARSGVFARGEFIIGERRALTLPSSAVVMRDGFGWALVIGADSRVHARKLQLGLRQGDRVEIASGLTPELRVVASGGAFLVDGDRVRVVAADARATKSAP